MSLILRLVANNLNNKGIELRIDLLKVILDEAHQVEEHSIVLHLLPQVAAVISLSMDIVIEIEAVYLCGLNALSSCVLQQGLDVLVHSA
jgi:hypothetical protein